VNALYRQQSSPVLKYWKIEGNALAPVGDPRFPHIATTYRLTEHYLSGAMSRWNPWLTELQPEPFVEISPELALEKKIGNTDWVKISTPRGSVRAKPARWPARSGTSFPRGTAASASSAATATTTRAIWTASTGVTSSSSSSSVPIAVTAAGS